MRRPSTLDLGWLLGMLIAKSSRALELKLG